MRFLPALAAGIVLCLGGLIAAPAQARDLAADREASKACVECHDQDDLPDMRRSAHAFTADPRTPSCLSCHGDSEAHLKKSQNKPDVVYRKGAATPITQRNAACLSCHERDAKRMLWSGSAHESADLACTSCHQIHTNHDKVLAKATQLDVCETCHKAQRTQLEKPSHHPVPEGQMTCSDCHNAHGSAGPKLVKRDSINDTCYTCHADKRGPFVHEHEPVTEDCSTCHNSHGSSVPSLLKARAPILCQECHTPHVSGGVGAVGGQPGVFPPAAPGQSAPAIGPFTNGKNVVNMWQGRSCLNCHTQVHGSNNPSVTNPTPAFLFR